MNSLCSRIFGLWSTQQSSQGTQSFVSTFADFKEASKKLSDIEKPLQILENTFTQEVRLNHARQVYPIYMALNKVTAAVAKKSLDSLTNSWQQVLTTLNNRKIYRIGLGSTLFDTSIAQEILTKKLSALQNSIVVSPIDIKHTHNRLEVVDYIHKMDQEAFGSCFQKGFLENILKSDDVRCIVARNEKNEIVGILWGFLTHHQDQQIFHFWEFSRKASMAHMGIAKKLINCAKQQQSLYPNLKFATLNVDADNKHAKEIYDKEHFATLNEEEKKAAKVFMMNELSSDMKVGLNPEVSKTIVKNFVLKTVPIHKLIYYELIRRCELIWRSCWYR